MVDRYDFANWEKCKCAVFKCNEGNFVKYEDYEKLKIEMLQEWEKNGILIKENEELKKEYRKLEERLEKSPYGDDKIDELESAIEFARHDIKVLIKENEELKKERKELRIALINALSYIDLTLGEKDFLIKWENEWALIKECNADGIEV